MAVIRAFYWYFNLLMFSTENLTDQEVSYVIPVLFDASDTVCLRVPGCNVNHPILKHISGYYL